MVRWILFGTATTLAFFTLCLTAAFLIEEKKELKKERKEKQRRKKILSKSMRCRCGFDPIIIGHSICCPICHISSFDFNDEVAIKRWNQIQSFNVGDVCSYAGETWTIKDISGETCYLYSDKFDSRIIACFDRITPIKRKAAIL